MDHTRRNDMEMKVLWVVTYILNNRFKTYASYDWTKADNCLRKVFEKGAEILAFEHYQVTDGVLGVK
jgi:predicted porin